MRLIKLLTGAVAAAFRRRPAPEESREDALARVAGIMGGLDITDKELDGVCAKVWSMSFDRSLKRASRIVAGWPEWKRRAVMGSLTHRS